MPIEGELERKGIADLLLQESNLPALLLLAKSLTKNVVDISSNEEALEVVYTQMTSTQAVLNKKVITKEILFKYVHSNRIPVSIDFTKAILINKIIEFWKSGAHALKQPSISPPVGKEVHEEEYPIHLLARKFSEWFFQNYNSSTLKVEDFWKDSCLMLRIAANDCLNDQQSETAEHIIETLLACKQQFNFFFNPNLTHDGVQGRMNVHGLVIVLVCGTLHTESNCVGVFETSFGLMRDPYALNNWKIKTIQILLRSQGVPSNPLLSESETLKASLALPAPTGEIS